MNDRVKTLLYELRDKSKEEVLVLLENVLWQEDKKIERLNNIISGIERFLNKLKIDTEDDIKYARSKNDDEEVIRLNRDFNIIDMILVKLQELKGEK